MRKPTHPIFNLRFLFAVLALASLPLCADAQMYQENTSSGIFIRAGIKAAAGYSKLFLSDAARPSFLNSADYSLDPEMCGKLGAVISVKTTATGQRLEFIFDPAFTKYSWGNFRKQETSTHINAFDIDMEAIELPISMRFNLLKGNRKIMPYIRGSYSWAYFVDTEFDYLSVQIDGTDTVKYNGNHFGFSKYQNAVALTGGLEFNFQLFDIFLEVLLEKGDGISDQKFGDAFLKRSNTTNIYLQLGVLF